MTEHNPATAADTEIVDANLLITSFTPMMGVGTDGRQGYALMRGKADEGRGHVTAEPRTVPVFMSSKPFLVSVFLVFQEETLKRVNKVLYQFRGPGNGKNPDAMRQDLESAETLARAEWRGPTRYDCPGRN
ncbi:hypothetical protein [Cystobacter ferrugineus]|uniref:hypothetical protein n=1 Tax=Cystobacter ferrugineus TaxID=83449 RepID=UPI001C9D8A9D|nr:hypothetical protein [Cystobacter ferrugineus]